MLSQPNPSDQLKLKIIRSFELGFDLERENDREKESQPTITVPPLLDLTNHSRSNTKSDQISTMIHQWEEGERTDEREREREREREKRHWIEKKERKEKKLRKRRERRNKILVFIISL